ncbi:hypothetical protein FMEXI_9621 [Fusarium mexicanum]|uniref:Uncharacterized protein n=1 Tax=Fusarium mexicanum TaxID=751941 RepID=A0A8H5MRC3_9HYPO|nr:hypothetical protein FMEXI_9621 [Fusarium mexicanum]
MASESCGADKYVDVVALTFGRGPNVADSTRRRQAAVILEISQSCRAGFKGQQSGLLMRQTSIVCVSSRESGCVYGSPVDGGFTPVTAAGNLDYAILVQESTADLLDNFTEWAYQLIPDWKYRDGDWGRNSFESKLRKEFLIEGRI